MENKRRGVIDPAGRRSGGRRPFVRDAVRDAACSAICCAHAIAAGGRVVPGTQPPRHA